MTDIGAQADLDLFVARQPILDRRGGLHGYELLFRSGLVNAFGNTAPDHASASTIGTGLMGFGLDELVGEHRAFLNVTREVLLGDLLPLLPPHRVVIELLESITPDDEVLAAVRRLRGAGYTVALDDYVGDPVHEPFLPLVDLVKVDVMLGVPEVVDRFAARWRSTGRPMLAEKVEDRAAWDRALAQGFTFFQGYYFCRPQIVAGRRLPASKLTLLRLMQEIANPDLDFARLERLVRQEMALSVSLLRYLNSAALGWRYRVESIEYALRVLGEETVKRWAMLLTMMGLGEGQPGELVTLSLVRARLCEAIAGAVPYEGRKLDAFLAGLLASVDALVGRPLEEVLGTMSLPAPVHAALTGADTPLGRILGYTLAHERGDWARAGALAAELGLEEGEVPRLYADATAWARQVRQA